MDTPCTSDQQQSLVSLVLNLVPNPDTAQRKAIETDLGVLAEHFGPSWTSVELLPLCIKQVPVGPKHTVFE